MITLAEIRANPTQYIELSGSGVIRHHSQLEKEFEGNFQLLIACVEDNIVERRYEGELSEHINWNSVFKDYDISYGNRV